jgi:hypothetical protein
MKSLVLFGAVVLMVFGLATSAPAADETLTGKVMCAKCTLKKADAKVCQDVLVVDDGKGVKAEYYIAKNAVSEKFGHICTGEQPATVTGAVTEKDGKKWITATKMEKPAAKS